MKINSIAKKVLTKSGASIALYVLAGWGVCAFLSPQPIFAQADSLQLSPNAPPRRVPRPSPEETGDFEVKGDKLRRCVTEASTNKKNCSDVMSGYGQIVSYGTDLYSQGKVAPAEAIFRQLITSFPKEATPHLKLGIILDRQGKTEEAISEYRKAIELNAKHAVARNSLAVALAKQGQLNEAITEWKEALTINPEYADAMTNLGIAMLQQGNKDEGVANLKKAKELFVKQKEFQKARQVDEVLQRMDSRTT